MISLSDVRARSLVWSVFLIVLLSYVTGIPFTKSLVHATPTLTNNPDLNGDGIVNLLDVAVLARAFHSYPGHPNWNPIADINGDEIVNVIDVVTLAINFTVEDGPSTEPEDTVGFLESFHTGCLWAYIYNSGHEAYPTWNPLLKDGYIKWTMRHISATMNSDGSCSGSFSDSKIRATLTSAFNDGIVPVIEFTRLTNWLMYNPAGPKLTEDMLRKFFTKWGNWLKTNYPDRFFIWNPACEFNYPEREVSSNGRNVAPDTYNEKMKLIRKVRDDLGLQDKILLGMHANLGWWAYGSLNEVITDFKNEEPYYEGFAQNDIVGFSHYSGYKNTDHNPSNADWRTTVEYSWRRAKMIWEAVCARAGKTLPFLWFEYSIGNVWKYEEDPIWKEAVTFTYTQMVQNNKWCKGLDWYVGRHIESDAIIELKKLSTLFNDF